MDQEILDRINKRLEELERRHTRYQGPVGKPGRDARITLGPFRGQSTRGSKAKT